MKKIIKEYVIYIFIFTFIFLIINIKIPFYIEKPGGLVNLSERLEENTTGSLNMAYVSILEASPLTYLISKIKNDWDLIKKEDEIGNSTKKEADFREKLMLEESYNLALINAYKLTNNDLNIKKQEVYVTYVYDQADTNLKIGDNILKIDDYDINSVNDINNYLKTLKENQIINIEVKNNNKIENKYAKTIKKGNKLIIGIFCNTKYDIKTNLKIKFEKEESGSSGGMMLTLALYSKIKDIDLTNNKIIAGTGTIDIDGKIGEISGVKYKLKGAVNNKADIFLVPSGKNYKEAIKIKEKNNYDIEIYSIETIQDAIKILEK